MNKKLLSAAVAVLLCLPFAGCTLAKPENPETEPTVAAKEQFVGLMVTLYDFDDWETPLNSTVFGEDTCVAEYLEYLPDGGEYGGKDGMPLFTADSSGDEYLFDGDQSTHISDDDGEKTSAYRSVITVYGDAELAGEFLFSVDTLSRDENGEIVREEGQRTASSSTSITHTVKLENTQTFTSTFDGKTERETVTLSIEITFAYREVGTDWAILQYAESGELLSRTPVSVADVGDFQLRADCAFAVTEERTSEGICRALYQKGETATFYYNGGFGLLRRACFRLTEN